jgi:hypothetical protein
MKSQLLDYVVDAKCSIDLGQNETPSTLHLL